MFVCEVPLDPQRESTTGIQSLRFYILRAFSSTLNFIREFVEVLLSSGLLLDLMEMTDSQIKLRPLVLKQVY